MKSESNLTKFLVVFALTIFCRLLPHDWGWTPAVAMSLIGSYFFGWRALIPMTLAHLSADCFLGFYDAPAMIGTYAGYIASAGVGMMASKNKNLFAVLGCSVLASAAFFVCSNFGVWLTPFYEHSWSGLSSCFVAAIPFWKNQFMADILLISATVLMLSYQPQKGYAKSHAKSSGFTLIELLVVMTIIAILSAVLFPVFNQAMSAAKKTQSITQLKQVNIASMMYANDNDGILMREHIDGASKTYYWWGSWDGLSLSPQESYLYSYMKNTAITQDPTLNNTMRTTLGMTGYGYNYAYLSPTQYDSNWNAVYIAVSESQVENTAETLTFASAARINNWSYSSWKLEGSALIDPPSYEYPGIHARHTGKTAVTAWIDGHVKAKSPVYRSQNFGYGMQPAWFKTSNLGDILNTNCGFGSDCQDYYYDLQ